MSVEPSVPTQRNWAMATPRSKLVDSENAYAYHLVSRCVRRSWLCGLDPVTGQDWSHRRQWLLDRMHLLARCFAVDIYAYAIMSNHFHLVLHYDPKASEKWSDGEVARRWIDAFPPTEKGRVAEELKPERVELLLSDRERLARARRTLGSLSAFMQYLKQPIARRANLEDGCQGHFFEQRFYSGALLSEEAVLAAMAYVDLNPVRARIAEDLEACHDTSIAQRLRENTPDALEDYLRPVASGLTDGDTNPPSRIGMTLSNYIALLAALATADESASRAPARVIRWATKASMLHKRQRAYGPPDRLRRWTTARGMRFREVPLPD